jgi:outer membrane receptor protein involved in Fe transport
MPTSAGATSRGVPDDLGFGRQPVHSRQAESLLAYEVRVKTPLFDRKVQLNAAGFYYDYSDKQILGRVPDPVLRSLQRLVNIPKSHIVGGEVEISARPIDGLMLSAAATYVKSRIDGSFVNYDNFAVQRRSRARNSRSPRNFPATAMRSTNFRSGTTARRSWDRVRPGTGRLMRRWDNWRSNISRAILCSTCARGSRRMTIAGA